MAAVTTKMSENGRLTIPASVRAAVGLERGGDVIVEVVDGELHVRTVAQAMERARSIALKIIAGRPGGTVKDFISERRRDADRDA
ncbi:MAG: AbrB/MazE/SpoVT family DNA-binding domain-containing protein [Caulobacteraceae bacterium]|nr:AbrB/MazE/SpoVT family DNA-binding domain-containing protein [Caulobacteraceae bacterium]